MNDKPSRLSRLLYLCGQVRDEQITRDEFAQLEAMLGSDTRARHFYLDFMRLHSELEPHASAGGVVQMADEEDDACANLLLEALELEERGAARRAKQQQAHRASVSADDRSPLRLGPSQADLVPVRHIVIPRWTVYAAVAAVLVLSAMLVWPDGEEQAVAPSSGPARHEPDLSAFTIHKTNAAEWDAASQPGGVFEGDEHRLSVRLLTLQRGYVELRSRRGARILIEGPATFRTNSDEALELLAGRLTVECPSEAVGFMIDTPFGTIKDLGTAFGVEVVDDAVEAHTFTGRIELHTDAGSAILVEHEAARIDHSGAIARQPAAAPGRFTRAMSEAAHRLRGYRIVHHFTRDDELIYRDTSVPPYGTPGAYEIDEGVLTIKPGVANVATVFMESSLSILEVGTIWAVDTQFDVVREGERCAYLVISDRSRTPGRARTDFGDPDAVGFRLRRANNFKERKSSDAQDLLRVEMDGAIEASGGVSDPGGKLTFIVHRVAADRLAFYIGVVRTGEVIALGEYRHAELLPHASLHLGLEAYSQSGQDTATFTRLRQLYRLDAWSDVDPQEKAPAAEMPAHSSQLHNHDVSSVR